MKKKKITIIIILFVLLALMYGVVNSILFKNLLNFDLAESIILYNEKTGQKYIDNSMSLAKSVGEISYFESEYDMRVELDSWEHSYTVEYFNAEKLIAKVEVFTNPKNPNAENNGLSLEQKTFYTLGDTYAVVKVESRFFVFSSTLYSKMNSEFYISIENLIK